MHLYIMSVYFFCISVLAAEKILEDDHLNTNLRELRVKANGVVDFDEFICYPRNIESGEISNEPIIVPEIGDARSENEQNSNEPGDFYDSISVLSRDSHIRDDEQLVTETKVTSRGGKRHRRKHHRRSRNKHNYPSDSERLQLDRCSMDTLPVYSVGVSSFSPQYTVRILYARNESNIFVEEQKEKFLIYRQPQLSEKESICDRKLQMRPEVDVSARAICPFRWVMDEPNLARIPQRLMVAKCSCQLSKPVFGQLARCVELKQKVTVLWRTGCDGDRHVYQEGHDEIAVACVPIDFTELNAITAANVHIKAST